MVSLQDLGTVLLQLLLYCLAVVYCQVRTAVQLLFFCSAVVYCWQVPIAVQLFFYCSAVIYSCQVPIAVLLLWYCSAIVYCQVRIAVLLQLLYCTTVQLSSTVSVLFLNSCQSQNIANVRGLEPYFNGVLVCRRARESRGWLTQMQVNPRRVSPRPRSSGYAIL